MSVIKFKILITGELHQEALELLKSVEASGLAFDYEPQINRAQLLAKISLFQGVMIRTSTRIDEELLGHAPQLKVVMRVGVGVDNIDIEACTKHKVRVANSPVGNRISTAEHAVGLIFALARDTVNANNKIKQGAWVNSAKRELGVEIYGKTLGIVGLGNIGREVAKRAQSLGMKVVARDPYLNPSVATQMSIPLLELKVLLEQSDFVSLHLPLTPETRQLADRDFFAAMKVESFLINTSRGAVVDENALTEALAAARSLIAAALDVFETEPLPQDHSFLKNPRIILTPHIAGQTQESALKMSVEAASKVISFFETGVLANAFN